MSHRFMHARCARRLLLPVLAAVANLCAADETSSEAIVADNVGPTAALPEVVVVGSTPLIASDLNRDQVPQTTRVLGAGDINRSGIPTLTGAILDNVASATVNDTEGNPFQPDILFRGFTASPVAGTPQGLAVYVNGARFNDAFGDTVNWDLIPPAAIDSVNLEAANPVYGLNAPPPSWNSADSSAISRSMSPAMPPTTTAFERPVPRICTGSTATSGGGA